MYRLFVNYYIAKFEKNKKVDFVEKKSKEYLLLIVLRSIFASEKVFYFDIQSIIKNSFRCGGER